MGLLERVVAASRARAITIVADDASSTRRNDTRRSLADALRGRNRLSLLAEFKRRSPTAPELAPTADLVTQLRAYEKAGAAAVSVLTEPTHFGGSLHDLRQARATIDMPILRKDFLVRPEQIRESAAAGADAVLLIVRCLSSNQLGEMLQACAAEGLEALVECHNQAELETALAHPETLIGINNRDLDTLHVDRGVARSLLPSVPATRIAIAESGYDDVQQLRELRGAVDAVLIGSALMRGSCVAAFAGEEKS